MSSSSGSEFNIINEINSRKSAEVAGRTCDNCRYGIKLKPSAQEILNKHKPSIECHWGPPSSTVILIPARPGMAPQQMVISAFPRVLPEFHCFKHELESE